MVRNIQNTQNAFLETFGNKKKRILYDNNIKIFY